MQPELKPAGLLRRVVARLADSLVLMPLNLGTYLLASGNRGFSAAMIVVSLPVVFSYFIFCHYRWGQTLGKMLLGLKVLSVDGERLTLIQCVLRSSVEIGFAALSAAFTLIGLFAIPAADFAGMGWQDQAVRLSQAVPALRLVNKADGLWAFVNASVLAFSPLKRAIHDHLAGTRVVVLEDGPKAEEAHPTSF